MKEADPYVGMPAGMSKMEWLASRMDASFPGLTDSGYLAAIKRAVLEVLGQRSSNGRERANLRVYLEGRNYSATAGFPDNPTGYVWPVEDDSEKDLISYEARQKAIDLLMNRVFAQRDALSTSSLNIDFSDILERSIQEANREYSLRQSNTPWHRRASD